MANDAALSAVVEKVLRQQAKLAGEEDINRLCQRLLQQLLALTSAHGGALYLLNDNRRSLVRTACTQLNDLHAPAIAALETTERNNLPDPLIDCVHRGAAIAINNIYSWNGYNCDSFYRADRLKPSPHQTTGVTPQQTRSLLLLPLQAGDQTLGTVLLRSVIADKVALLQSDHSDFQTAVASLADAYARQASVFIASHRLQRQNQALLAAANDKNARLTADNKALEQREKLAKHQLVMGRSPVMRAATDKVFQVAKANATVLLQGETGVGKEVFARLLHQHSERADKPLVIQNCAALPANLLEAELFGYRKGAFTGADRNHPGLFRSADGGTLFLDEIGEMPLEVQAKLLRVLQEQTVRGLGEVKEQNIDVRIVTATHKNLKSEVAEGNFRQDLYYRLNVFPIVIPSLRERPEDIAELTQHFFSILSNGRRIELSVEAQDLLRQHHWPGNVRELRHCVERLIINHPHGSELGLPDVISALDLAEKTVHASTTDCSGFAPQSPNSNLREVLRKTERDLIGSALQYTDGDTAAAAKQLELPVRTLREKMQRLHISRM